MKSPSVSIGVEVNQVLAMDIALSWYMVICKIIRILESPRAASILFVRPISAYQ